MENFSEANAATLNELAEAGTQVFSVVYNPTTLGVGDDPEGDALAAGLVEYYREDTAELVEIIYVTA